jgi:hypothetical protein
MVLLEAQGCAVHGRHTTSHDTKPTPCTTQHHTQGTVLASLTPRAAPTCHQCCKHWVHLAQEVLLQVKARNCRQHRAGLCMAVTDAPQAAHVFAIGHWQSRLVEGHVQERTGVVDDFDAWLACSAERGFSSSSSSTF